jgi:hypothetical protein
MNTLVFDIETGGLPEEELKKLYREKSLDEFSADCDKRWKPETITAKYEEYKVSGWKEFVDRAALSPLTGRVLAIGIQKCEKVVVIGDGAETEPEILSIFWDVYKKYHANQGRIVGFNSNGFDVPFLTRRSWWHGVEVPESILDANRRYLSKTFVDLMAYWGVGNREFVGLGNLCQWFGLGQKPEGVTGAHFASLWLSGDPASRQAALEYLKNDLLLTWKLAERMGVIL